MIAVDIDQCTGCGTCELVCSFRHHGEFNPRKARIHKTVFLHEMYAVPILCQQCEDPWCGRICPSGAIIKHTDEATGASIVTVSEDRCVGCKMCMLACPNGSIVVVDQCAQKCDLCGGDPQCVKFCTQGALRFVDAEDSALERKRRLAVALLASRKEAE